MYNFTEKIATMKRSLILGFMIVFACAVMPSHSFASDYHKYPTKGGVVSAKVFNVDQLFVCTADVYTIFVNAKIPYAPAKNVIVVAPIKLVEATGNSPPENIS